MAIETRRWRIARMLSWAARLRLPALLLLGLLFAVWWLGGTPRAEATPPHFANRNYPVEQVFHVLGALNAGNGAPQEHSSVVFHQGYVVEVYSEENDRPRGGIAFFDLSDPAAPQLVSRTEENTNRLAEQHAIGFHNLDGREYAALLAIDGVEIWDWTNVTQPQQVSRVSLPGVAVGYGVGAWWLAWQAPYLYVSGASNGIYIVDTSDPAHPFLVDREDEPNPIPTSETGGFRIGPIFAIGNLLVISANDGRGYATLDIGDPLNPVLLDAETRGLPPSYSSMVNGNRLYAVGTDDDFHALDISDPMQIRLINSTPMGGRGGYLTIQDNFAHVGASSHYVKIDLSDEREFRVAGTASSGLAERDEDFAVALGNLVILSDDQYNGSFIFAHQAEPDTTGPQVNMVVPTDGAGHQSRASRIGLTFTDRIDLRTVNAETLIVRPVGSDEALPGRYSSQTGIVNFTPDRPLEPDTTYEIVVPAGGIRDVAGNATPVTFRSTFSTGDANGAGFWCAIEPPAPVETGRTATFQARVLEGPPGLLFRWTFGDGQDSGEPSAANSAGHTYTQPGHYIVRVQVTDGRRSTGCSTLVTVYNRPLPGVAPASSTIILDQSGTQVWNVNPDNNSVTATDAVNLTKMFEAPVGVNPRTLAQAPDGSMWVVNQGDATISVLSSETGALLATIPLPAGSEPYGIVFHPRQPTAYVSLQATGQLARLDATGRAVTGLLATGPTPRGLAMTANGQRLFVTRFISPDTHGEVVEIDPAAFTVRRILTLPFDPGPDTESSGRGVPNGLNAALVSPDGTRLWVASRKHNIARGQQRDGQRLTFESTVRSIIAQIDLATGEELLSERHDFNNRDGPVAARFSPLGDYLFVVLEGSNAVEVLDAYSGQMIASIEAVGAAPQGLVFTSDGSKLFVHSWLTRSLLVYDVANILKPAARSARLLGEISTVDKERLPADQLAGKRIFYNAEDPRMDRDEYIACASCHFDSRDDGRVWDRTAEGEGLRNTISLLGRGGPEHGRMHWSANFDEVQDFEHDIRAAFGGSGFLSDDLLAQGSRADPLGDPKAGLSAELDALAAYVSSLRTVPASPYRAPDGALTEAGVKGKEIFRQAGCAGCHGGPAFTDSPSGLLHDVGTLSAASGGRLGGPLPGLDTPSLRGLWLTPPYLHDGSAPTLMDVFTTRNPAGRHGMLAEALAADPQALDYLVAYLLQIDDHEPGPSMPSPAVELVSPTDGARFATGEPIHLAVNTAPILGPVARVEFLANDVIIGEDPDVLYTLTWTGAAPGAYELTARLVYANGASTTSRPVTVYVAP